MGKVPSGPVTREELMTVCLFQLNYADMLKRVEPLRNELQKLEDDAKDNQQKANEVEQMIRDLEASIARYKEEYAVLISEAQAIKADLAAVEAKVRLSPGGSTLSAGSSQFFVGSDMRCSWCLIHVRACVPAFLSASRLCPERACWPPGSPGCVNQDRWTPGGDLKPTRGVTKDTAVRVLHSLLCPSPCPHSS